MSSVRMKTRPICCPTCGAALKDQQAHVDLDTNTFLFNGVSVPLRAKEAEMLDILVRRAPMTVAHETLYRQTWGIDEPTDVSNTTRAHISRLRVKIRPTGALVVNEPGIGYRFIDEARA